MKHELDLLGQLDEAITLAFDVFEDKYDKGNKPYTMHLSNVAEKVYHWDSDVRTKLKMIAYLHDVIEDTHIQVKDLNDMGFDPDVVDAVVLLTHVDEVPYKDYVCRLSTHYLAKIVKIADLEDNMDITRLNTFEKRDAKRLRKYFNAYKFLTGKLSEEEYRKINDKI